MEKGQNNKMNSDGFKMVSNKNYFILNLTHTGSFLAYVWN